VLAEIAAIVDKGKIDIPVAKTYPLNLVQEACR
jgi:hypothetical protein